MTPQRNNVENPKSVDEISTNPSEIPKPNLIYWGALAVLVLILVLRAVPLAAILPSWLAHVIVFAAAVGTWRVITHKSQLRAASVGKVNFSRIRMSIAAFLVFSFSTPLLVVWKAENFADGAPYCIQVASDQESVYKPAETLLDLSALTMKATFGTQYHAILFMIKDDRVQAFNWSYRKFSFAKDVILSVQSNCGRQANFAWQLPVFLAN